jgi:transposase-like protein
MTNVRRRYRLVDEETKAAAVATAVKCIEEGTSFTAACSAVAEQVDVSETAVRGWVNASGLRPQPSWDVVRQLQLQLEAATELTRRLTAGRSGRCEETGLAE